MKSSSPSLSSRLPSPYRADKPGPSSSKEAEQIQCEGIKVVFSDQKIHSDDSIGTIKIKIINEFKSEISLDEIYLYCQKMETLNAVSVYQSLTQNGKLQLTKVRLDQFISNIVCEENGKPFEKPVEKEVYTFDDLFEMKFDNKKYVVNLKLYKWKQRQDLLIYPNELINGIEKGLKYIYYYLY